MPEVETKEDHEHKAAPADFETAIDAVGFGRYNIFLMLMALFSSMGAVFETSTMSYILQSAECDLNLSLLDKGQLNAITYAGMISSAVIWGYIADTKGRKRILVFGSLLDGICVLGSAMSQNVIVLMMFKYLGGFIAGGPFAVLMTYLSELHGRQHRAFIMMMVGITFSIAALILPALALAILPNVWNFHIYGLSIHSWQIFLAVTSIPSLLSAVLLLFFPESPKFLMSQGRNKEAMEIFRTIYAVNKRVPRNNYPIKELTLEVPDKYNNSDNGSIATIEAHSETEEKHTPQQGTSWRNGLRQLRPLFTKPYLTLSLRVYLLNFCVLFGQNTIRLWLPQLFASIAEYAEKFDGPTSMCNILEYSVNKTAITQDPTNEVCEVIISASAYTNNIIVAMAGFCGYIVVGFLVNIVDNKLIMTIALAVNGVVAIGLYWSVNSLSTLIISSVFVNLGSIASTSVISATASLFPTTLRTMVVSLTLMLGRTGSLLGNILFPVFISAGCIAPFSMLTAVMFIACLIAAFLPNTKKTVLK